MRKLTLRLFVTAILALSLTAAACAAYPERAVSMVVAYAPGGGSDISARAFEPFLSKTLGASIAVVNKPGGNGEVGFSSVATAAPDGYTIGVINLPVFFINLHTRKTTYSFDQFEILAPMGGSEHTIGVAENSEIKTLDDLVKTAKEKPSVLTIGSSGNFSDDYLAYLRFEKSLGIQLIHVPFKGAGPARTAVLGNHVNLIAFNVDEAIPFVQSGQIRLLGIMSEKRHPMLPDVPTFKEQGYDIISSSSRALAAPKGLPEDVLAKLRKAAKSAATDAGYLQGVQKMGQTFEWMELPEYVEQLGKESEQTQQLLEEAAK